MAKHGMEGLIAWRALTYKAALLNVIHKVLNLAIFATDTETPSVDKNCPGVLIIWLHHERTDNVVSIPMLYNRLRLT